MYFPYFIIIPPLKRVWPFFWSNSNPLYPRMICAKSDFNWSNGSGEDFLNFVNVFALFRNYLPLETGVAPHMKNLNSRHPRMLCANFLKLARLFWRSWWKCEKFTDRRMTGDQKSSFKLSGLKLIKKLLQYFALDAVNRFTAEVSKVSIPRTMGIPIKLRINYRRMLQMKSCTFTWVIMPRRKKHSFACRGAIHDNWLKKIIHKSWFESPYSRENI